MPAFDPVPPGAPCWIDLMTSDADKSVAFYRGLFGWTVGAPDDRFGGYRNFSHNDAPVGGLMTKPADFTRPDAWSIYLKSDDVERVVAETVAQGGQVFVPPRTVGDLGAVAFVVDPAGAGIGAWQTNRFSGLLIEAAEGTPMWFELVTYDIDRAVSYYRDVFSWQVAKLSDAPRYETLDVDGEPYAGVLDANGIFSETDVPAHWAVYFAVHDIDATLERIGRFGGSVLRPAETTTHGQVAWARDATGALFKLLQPNAASAR